MLLALCPALGAAAGSVRTSLTVSVTVIDSRIVGRPVSESFTRSENGVVYRTIEY